MEEEMHPSGMPQKRWDWPFKTPQEMELVKKYFAARYRKELEELPPALI